jgi:hypothetical protein
MTETIARVRLLTTVCHMVSDPKATALANQHGMRIMDVTWEDNGRTKGSSWGPCISDSK